MLLPFRQVNPNFTTMLYCTWYKSANTDANAPPGRRAGSRPSLPPQVLTLLALLVQKYKYCRKQTVAADVGAAVWLRMLPNADVCCCVCCRMLTYAAARSRVGEREQRIGVSICTFVPVKKGRWESWAPQHYYKSTLLYWYGSANTDARSLLPAQLPLSRCVC
jgi:hypothetical protein